jgi:hypothetical protein
MRKTTKMFIAAATAATVLTGCSSEADTTSDNLSKAADNFEILRRVVFFNGITDTYLLTIEGFCSITDEGNQVEVTCKIAEGEDAGSYEKHFLGLSDNVTYFAEQLDPAGVDPFHHRIVFRPETIVPDIDLQTSE